MTYHQIILAFFSLHFTTFFYPSLPFLLFFTHFTLVTPLGTIGLPPKVINSLWEDGNIKGTISIKYVKLSKVVYVKLQPKFNQFFKVEQIKMVLEENLKYHSTLTLGDIVTVWYRGIAHPLKIVEMKPFDKGILLDTDVEVDLDNSLENTKNSEKNVEKKSENSNLGEIVNSEGVSGKREGTVNSESKSVPRFLRRSAISPCM